MSSCKFKISIFPIFCSCFMTFTILLMYYLATSNGHVVSRLPTISETGSFLPERGFFSYMIFIESLATLWRFVSFFIPFLVTASGGLAVYFRYRFISLMNVERKLSTEKLNVVAVSAGYGAAAAMVGVAAFPCIKKLKLIYIFSPFIVLIQESTQPHYHLVSAGFLFLCASVYMILDALLSYSIRSGRILTAIRAVIALIGFTVGICTLYFFVAARVSWNRGTHEHNKEHRNPSDSGYGLFTAAAGFEWGLIISLLLYFVTLGFEMHEVHSELKIVIPESNPIHMERLSLNNHQPQNATD